MYGLVNQAVQDLIIRHHGAATWKKICDKAGVSVEDFSAMTPYPDEMTYSLVGAASEILGTPAADLLRAFGDHWITFTADEGYGDLMELFGKDLITCLRNLNRMHAHMGAMMPKLRPPRFQIEEIGGQSFKLHYFSERAGLAPMVIGLLEGLARKHGSRVEIVQNPRTPDADHDTFVLKVLA